MNAHSPERLQKSTDKLRSSSPTPYVLKYDTYNEDAHIIQEERIVTPKQSQQG